MRRLLLTATTVLYLSTSDGLEASTVRQLNLGEMVQRAELIYRGTVLSASAETVEVGGGQLPVTVYRLKVEESFRGEFTEVKGVRIAELRTLGKLKTVRSGDLQSMAVLPRTLGQPRRQARPPEFPWLGGWRPWPQQPQPGPANPPA